MNWGTLIVANIIMFGMSWQLYMIGTFTWWMMLISLVAIVGLQIMANKDLE